MTELDDIAQAVALKLVESQVFSPNKKRKQRTNWESLFVREYANRFYLNCLKWFRHEVGPFDPNDPVQAYSQLRRFCDLIVDVNDSLYVIEAKMKPTPSAISQLQTYITLIRQTPDLEYYWDKPMQGIILTTMDDPAVRKTANDWGFLYEVFEPSFMDEWKAMMVNRYKKMSA